MVVGLSPDPTRDSFHVARYLQQQGYRIIPVNPAVDEILGEKSYPDLASVPGPIDLVDVFRRPEYVLPIAKQAVAVKARAIWFQLGIINSEAIEEARRGGLDVVVDRCAMVEHQRLISSGKL